MLNYTQKQIDQAMDKLPAELEEVFSSVETAENIMETCETYGIVDERVKQISSLVGLVLLGLLPPQEFQKNLQKDVNLPKVLVEPITREINRFIFYPVRSLLQELYKVEITTPERPTKKAEPLARKVEEKPKKEEKSKTRPGEDVYREPIE